MRVVVVFSHHGDTIHNTHSSKEKVYFGLQFIETSVRGWLAPGQGSMAEEKEFLAWQRKQDGSSKVVGCGVSFPPS